MTGIADTAHLKDGIWMVIGAHLSRLDALVEELRKKFEAKDAEAIEKTGRYIAECGMDLVSDANSITVLDCLGQPLMTKMSYPCPKCGSRDRVYYDSVKEKNHCLTCGHTWKAQPK